MQIDHLSQQNEQTELILDQKTSRIKELERRLLGFVRELEEQRSRNNALKEFEQKYLTTKGSLENLL